MQYVAHELHDENCAEKLISLLRYGKQFLIAQHIFNDKDIYCTVQ